MMKKAKLRKMYFDIYMKYTNNDISLEDIGINYNISKQRVWQIVRFCKLGNGDYYTGLKDYNERIKKIRHYYPTASSKEINQLMRQWLRINNIRLIKNG